MRKLRQTVRWLVILLILQTVIGGAVLVHLEVKLAHTKLMLRLVALRVIEMGDEDRPHRTAKPF